MDNIRNTANFDIRVTLWMINAFSNAAYITKRTTASDIVMFPV